jgi:DNA repair protein RecN (Recombination protein N)
MHKPFWMPRKLPFKTWAGREMAQCAALQRACHSLQQSEHLEPSFKGLAEVLQSSLAQVDETPFTSLRYLRKTELDPQRLAQLDERMALWVSLARRYNDAPAELPAVAGRLATGVGPTGRCDRPGIS